MFNGKETALVVVVSRIGARSREPRSIRILSIDSFLTGTRTNMKMKIPL